MTHVVRTKYLMPSARKLQERCTWGADWLRTFSGERGHCRRCFGSWQKGRQKVRCFTSRYRHVETSSFAGFQLAFEAIDIPIKSSEQDLSFGEGWQYLFPWWRYYVLGLSKFDVFHLRKWLCLYKTIHVAICGLEKIRYIRVSIWVFTKILRQNKS